MSGNSLDRWTRKVNDFRDKLLRWSRSKFKQREQQIDEMMEKLGSLQKDWGANVQEIEVLMKRVDRLWGQDESFWQQTSRIKWLQEGDFNTSFFHQSTIMQRRRRNKVVSLRDRSGGWVDNPQVVRNIIDNHFINLFTSVGQRDWGSILDCVTPKVTAEMNGTLTAPISMEEVKSAALQMGGLKAPGPYDFQGIFYHSYWDILLNDVS